jgi:hypothetical protein
MGTLVAGIEEMMRKSGLGEIEAIRLARELFLDSRSILMRISSSESTHSVAKFSQAFRGTPETP